MLTRRFRGIFECPRTAVPPSPHHHRALSTVVIAIAGESMRILNGLQRLCVRSRWLVPVAFSILFLQGCSSNSSSNQDPSVTISVTPTSAFVATHTTQQF